MQESGRSDISPWQEINHNEHQEYQGDNDDTINFSSEVYLLVGKLVPVVAIHSLGGSRANRLHKPNPQPGAAQSTQDEDPKDTHNPLELPSALYRGRHKNPSKSQ
jgi:hypothetical protein